MPRICFAARRAPGHNPPQGVQLQGWRATADAERVNHFFSKVAGVTHANADGTRRQDIIRRCRILERLTVEHQDDNPHDPNAVRVFRANGEQLGFLRAELAEQVVERSRVGYRYAFFISNLTGGTRSTPTRGVNLLVIVAEPGTSDAEAQAYAKRLTAAPVGHDPFGNVGAQPPSPPPAAPPRPPAPPAPPPQEDRRAGELAPLRWKARRASWALQSVRIRQTARKAFDLTRLGNGPAERLCSALILGAVFFFVALVVGHAALERPAYAIGVAGLALASVMAASAALVLWKSDAQLAAQGPRLQEELAELREAVAEARAAHEAEKERRVAASAYATAKQRARPRPTSKPCPYCRETIQAHAVKCKHCGEILDEELRRERQPRPRQRWSPGVAAVLSLLIPGLGQIYKGQILNGLAWMFLVVVGYVFCIVPGIFLHVVCIFGAASGGDD